MATTNQPDVSSWTRSDYDRNAICVCGHTAYWHGWIGVDQIGACDDATYVPPDSGKVPCGCIGFRLAGEQKLLPGIRQIEARRLFDSARALLHSDDAPGYDRAIIDLIALTCNVADDDRMKLIKELESEVGQ